MTSITTPNYSDIYPGEKPTLDALLGGINAKVIVLQMAMISAELHWEGDVAELQLRLLEVMTRRFDKREMNVFKAGLKRFSDKIKGAPVVFWAIRYTRALMKYALLHCEAGDSIGTSPDQETRILKAYLLMTEQMNERDRQELKSIREKLSEDEPFFFEKLVWPFALFQFDANNRVNPAWEFVRLLSFIAYSVDKENLRKAWSEFLEKNGFNNVNEYLGSVFQLMAITQRRFNQRDFKVFGWIDANNLPAHLINLSFDVAAYKKDEEK